MTLAEFENEFKVRYNAASNGAPDLNSYEISLFLTQAIRDMVLGYYANFESNEASQRALNPLIASQEFCVQEEEPSNEYAGSKAIDETPGQEVETITDYYTGYVTQRITLPSDVWFLLQEQVTMFEPSCGSIIVEVVAETLDNMNKTIKNPFKRPNERKVIRLVDADGFRYVRIVSASPIDCYKVKYLKKYTPIILANFAEETDLVGDETIDGFNTVRNTELPVFLHDEIVKRGVLLAIKSLRENNLQTQLEV